MSDNKSMADAARIIALELATNELAERLAKMESNEGGPLWQNRMVDMQKRIGELEQYNIAIRARLTALELQPKSYPQPYPIHPGWTPTPGYVPMSPWWSPPVYCATKESTQ